MSNTSAPPTAAVSSGQQAPNQPKPVTTPPAPAKPSTGGMFDLGGMANDLVNSRLTPRQREFKGVFDQHKVPLGQQLNFANQAKGLQGQLSQGNYLQAYPGVMQMIGDMKKQDPNLPSAVSPLLEKHYGVSPMAWNVARGWHGMVGTPQGFAGTMSALAPGLLRGAGNAGGAVGVLGLHGLISGDKSIAQDLGNVFMPKSSAYRALALRLLR